MTQLPAVSLAAVPGRRLRTIELAKDIERRGFPGIFGPSLGDSLALCNAIALNTTDVMIGTSITPIYTRNVADFAQTAGFLHEVSEGRFRFGVGVSHAPALNRMGITAGKPLSDMRQFVEDMEAVPTTNRPHLWEHWAKCSCGTHLILLQKFFIVSRALDVVEPNN